VHQIQGECVQTGQGRSGAEQDEFGLQCVAGVEGALEFHAGKIRIQVVFPEQARGGVPFLYAPRGIRLQGLAQHGSGFRIRQAGRQIDGIENGEGARSLDGRGRHVFQGAGAGGRGARRGVDDRGQQDRQKPRRFEEFQDRSAPSGANAIAGVASGAAWKDSDRLHGHPPATVLIRPWLGLSMHGKAGPGAPG
jgi:hypothetical protein